MTSLGRSYVAFLDALAAARSIGIIVFTTTVQLARSVLLMNLVSREIVVQCWGHP